MEEEAERTAIHEAGHAVIARVLKQATMLYRMIIATAIAMMTAVPIAASQHDGWISYSYPTGECLSDTGSPADLIDSDRVMQKAWRTKDTKDPTTGKLARVDVYTATGAFSDQVNTFFRTRAGCDLFAAQKELEIEKYRLDEGPDEWSLWDQRKGCVRADMPDADDPHFKILQPERDGRVEIQDSDGTVETLFHSPHACRMAAIQARIDAAQKALATGSKRGTP